MLPVSECSRKCFIHYNGNQSFGNYNCLNIDIIVNGYIISTAEILIIFIIILSWITVFYHFKKINNKIKLNDRQYFHDLKVQ